MAEQINFSSKKTETKIVKPVDIIYGIDDSPPLVPRILLGLQQFVVTALYLSLITLLAAQTGMKFQDAQYMMSTCLIVMGIAALLQSHPGKHIGSGFLIVSSPIIISFTGELNALKIGGFALLAGMNLFCGFIEITISSIIKKLKIIFPPIISGLIFLFIGLEICVTALRNVLPTTPGSIHTTSFSLGLIVFFVTFGLIVAIYIWAPLKIQLFSIIIGVTFGAILANFLNLYLPVNLENIAKTSFFAIPDFRFEMDFSFGLIPLFVVIAFAESIKAVGLFTTSQQINDANFSKADYDKFKPGILADGLAMIFSGLLGTKAVGLSPSAVGVSKATGATSRNIAYVAAIICFALALMPKFTSFILAIPLPVISAGIFFPGCILIAGGAQLITIDHITSRRALILGVSLSAALTTVIFPEFYAQCPKFIRDSMVSMLFMGTLTAIILNLIFRIKISKKKKWKVNKRLNGIDNFISGIKKELPALTKNKAAIKNIISSTEYIIRIITEKNSIGGNMLVHTKFDDMSYKVSLLYRGELPKILKTTNITDQDLIEELMAIKGVINNYVTFAPDNITVKTVNKRTKIELKFDIY